jgi:hypothetical protein
VFEALRTIRDGSRCHPLLALGTKRAVDWQQLWVGFFPAAHNGEKIGPNQNICLSGSGLCGGKNSRAALRGCRGKAQAAQSETEGSASIVPNEPPYLAGLEVDGFPSGTSTSFLKKVRMRSRCEAAMSEQTRRQYCCVHHRYLIMPNGRPQ